MHAGVMLEVTDLVRTGCPITATGLEDHGPVADEWWREERRAEIWETEQGWGTRKPPSRAEREDPQEERRGTVTTSSL